MAITVHDKNNPCIIRHDAALTATEVADLKKLLSEQSDSCQDVTLEFTALTDCDTLGVQLLLSAERTAQKHKKSFNIKGDIAILYQAAERIGLNFEEYFDRKGQIDRI